jgi:hypothetical protein
LTRELGHLPVKGELLLKRTTDSSFPNDKTFGRFGGQAGLIRRVPSYCREHGGFDDILQLCELEQSGQRREAVPNHGTSNSNPGGYVFLVKSGRHYKIGHSNSVGRREYELAIQLPERVQVVHQILTDDPAGIEAYWHQAFLKQKEPTENGSDPTPRTSRRSGGVASCSKAIRTEECGAPEQTATAL